MPTNIDDIMHPAPRPTRAQVEAAIGLVVTVGQIIQLKGEIPSGELYVEIQTRIPSYGLREHELVIGKLKSVGVVKESAHLLTWIGPKMEAK